MLVFALLLAASGAHVSQPLGPGSGDLIAALGPFRPEAGAWVEYLVRSRGEQDVRVRIAVLPPVLDRGRAWLEVATVGSRSLPFATRLLVNAATGKLEHASVYALGQAPIEVPVGDGDAPAPVAAPRPRIVRGRSKSVSVPAGTFTATELRVSRRGESARVWRSDQVPLWGMVRAEEGRRTIELLRFGRSGARSVFPGFRDAGQQSDGVPPASHGNGSERAKE